MNLFIDIETIPSANMPELEYLQAPANYKNEEKIKEWKESNRIEVYKKQALDSMKGRIICIGYAVEQQEPVVMCDIDEIAILNWFSGEYLYDIISGFVGWNILSFDIPWLWRKAIQHDLKDLRRVLPHQNTKMCIDLMKVWASEYRDYVSLANCAKFLGVEHDGGNGSEIYDLWQANDLDAIADHCRRDIITTQEIYRRIYD